MRVLEAELYSTWCKSCASVPRSGELRFAFDVPIIADAILLQYIQLVIVCRTPKNVNGMGNSLVEEHLQVVAVDWICFDIYLGVFLGSCDSFA